MLEVSQHDIRVRVERDNPWWSGATNVQPESDYPRRIYFSPFRNLAANLSIRRAVVLMGPRRVGKTVMLRQLVQELINEGEKPKNILYASIDTPLYSQIPLEKFIDFFENHPAKNGSDRYFVLFDEVQYLANWEVHLKDLVDRYRNVKFVASGSAAAALRLASTESGAGRFSDFQLPPLTFAEFIQFIGKEDELITQSNDKEFPYSARDISALNDEFVNYVNYGGYPEAALSSDIRENADQFVRNDIIDKVLLKDLPALYGISNIQELNRLFTYLAYNTGEEVSLQSISERSGVTKPTISKYIEYLRSAFLVMKVSRIDQNARRFTRETNFKVYLNNPSMRAALFSPVSSDQSSLLGHLAESAVFAQWLHGPQFEDFYYARWGRGEIDMISLSGPELRPEWAVEIKWSDRAINDAKGELKGLYHYLESKKIKDALVTTLTKRGHLNIAGKSVQYLPTSEYCYTVGRNTSKGAIFEMQR